MRYDKRYYDNSSCDISNHGSACKCYIANSSLITKAFNHPELTAVIAIVFGFIACIILIGLNIDGVI